MAITFAVPAFLPAPDGNGEPSGQPSKESQPVRLPTTMTITAAFFRGLDVSHRYAQHWDALGDFAMENSVVLTCFYLKGCYSYYSSGCLQQFIT